MLRNTLNTFMTATLIMLLGVSSSAQTVVPANTRITSTSTLDLADGTSLEKSVTVTVGLKPKAPEVRHLGGRPADGQWIAGAPFFHEYGLISRANGEDTYAPHVTLDRDASTHLGGTPEFSIRVLNGPVLSDSKIALGATAVLVPAEAGATELIVPNDLTPTDDVVNGISVGDYVFVGNRSKPHRVSAIMSETDTVTLVLSGDGIASAVETGDLIAEGALFHVEVSGDLRSTHEADPAIAVIAVTAEVSGDSADLSETVTAQVIVPKLVTLTASVTGPGVLIDDGNDYMGDRWFSCSDSTLGSDQFLDSVPKYVNNFGPLNLCEVSFIPEDVEKYLMAVPADGYFVKAIEGCDRSGAPLTSVPLFYCVIEITENKSVNVVFEKKPRLDISVEGSGVVLGPDDINCGGDACGPELGTPPCEDLCSIERELDSETSLLVWPAHGYVVEILDGCDQAPLGPRADEGGRRLCLITENENKSVNVVFEKKKFDFVVQPGEGGAIRFAGTDGQITDPDGGALNGEINCSAQSSCEYTVEHGTQIELTAVPGSGRIHQSWNDCPGEDGPSCTITVTEAATVAATFGVEQIPLTVRIGAGYGIVSSDPEGKSLDWNESETVTQFDKDSTVTLTALPRSGEVPNPVGGFMQRRYRVDGWTGCTEQVGDTCQVTMDAAKTVEVSFVSEKALLTVISGASGTVRSVDVEGIDCASGETCVSEFDQYSLVTLRAEPNDEQDQVEWAGACITCNDGDPYSNENDELCQRLGQNACWTRGIDYPADSNPWVVGSPNYIEGAACYRKCAAPGFQFESTCFEFVWFANQVAYNVRCNAPGNDWRSAGRYTLFTLSTGNELLDFNNRYKDRHLCADSNVPQVLDNENNHTCTVLVDKAKIVETRFAESFATQAPRLDISVEGGGVVFEKEKFDFVVQPGEGGAIRLVGTDGQITDPEGNALNGEINCSAQSSCEYTVEHGTQIELTAVPDEGYRFDRWSGDCEEPFKEACTVTVAKAKTVEASFVSHPVLTVHVGKGGNVIVDDGPPCASEAICNPWFNSGTEVSLVAQPQDGYTFDGWDGACSGGTVCNPTLIDNQTVSASFSSIQYSLEITKNGNGNVVTRVDGEEINCPGGVCGVLDYGADVTLSAEADEGNVLTSWSGDCQGTSLSCDLVIDGPKEINADFRLLPEDRPDPCQAGSRWEKECRELEKHACWDTNESQWIVGETAHPTGQSDAVKRATNGKPAKEDWRPYREVLCIPDSVSPDNPCGPQEGRWSKNCETACWDPQVGIDGWWAVGSVAWSNNQGQANDWAANARRFDSDDKNYQSVLCGYRMDVNVF